MPVVSVEPKELVVKPGDVIQIQCSGRRGQQPVRYEWSKVDGQMSSSAFDADGLLEIFDTNAGDAGRYRCRATNQAGYTDAFADVILQGLWRAQNIGNIADTEVVISLL